MKKFNNQKYVGQKWRMKCGLLYAGLGGLGGLECKLVGPDDAMVFDSRDNREMKANFYGMMLKCKFEIEEVS